MKKIPALGIILLLVGVTIAPAIAQNTEKSQSTSRGNWLYVGGGGPGNYTRIQDAINNASNGDSVFVYHGIYQEHLEIYIDLDLIGENTETTIIDGDGTGDIISLGGNINVTGFTIQNGEMGIQAIGVLHQYSFTLYRNIIRNCGIGLYIDYSNHNLIYQNEITNNTLGIYLFRTVLTRIHQNNFIDNEKQASFIFMFFYQTLFLHYNSWKGNYWSDWQRDLPRLIPGKAVFFYALPWGVPSIVPVYSSIAFDWHSAQEPYDISGMN